MPRHLRFVAGCAALLVGCATPGYRIELEAHAVAADELEPLVSKLERTAASTGFDRHWFRRDGGSPFPGFTSTYSKVLSETPHDHSTIDIFYFSSERSVMVVVQNALRGMEPPLKAELDALGDAFVADMAACVGRGRVSEQRMRWSRPLLW